jgi:hypothetical protein
MIFSRIEKMNADASGMAVTPVAPVILVLLTLTSLANLPLGSGGFWEWATALLGQLASVRQEGPTVSLRPAENHVEAEEAFTVQVLVEDVSDLGAFQLKVSFPPAVVQARDVGLGEFLGSTGRNATALRPSLDNETGTMTFGAFTLGNVAGPTGAGTLAEVRFEAVQQGHGTLGLLDVQLIDTAARVMTVSAVDASVRVCIGQAAPTSTSSPPVEPSQPPRLTVLPTNTPSVVQTLEASAPTWRAPVGKTEEGKTPGTDILPSITPTPPTATSPTQGGRGIRQAGTRLMVVGAMSIALVGLIVLIVGYLLYRKY